MSGARPAAECRFCKIVRGELESYMVFEDDLFVAFLDHRPLFAGHCLLMPREHHETLLDLPAGLIGGLFHNAQLIASALERGLGCDGSFVAINNRVSQSVPHLHVHVVPRRHKDGLRGFFWPRQPYPDPESARRIQDRLRGAIAELGSPGPSPRP